MDASASAEIPPVACLRCGAEPDDPFAPCPACLEEGVAANHRLLASTLAPEGALPPAVPPSPLRPLATQPRAFLKDERGGMTWSWKDRLAAAAVAHAARAGAETVVVCSSGNHGAAVASAAAVHGLRCVVLTMTSIAPAMQQLVTGCGGVLVPLGNAEECWTVMREAIATLGWHPASNAHDPAIGSSPYAIAGYRAIAHELVEQLGAPDWVVVPVGFGDGLCGIAQGFEELAERDGLRTPKLLAAVTSPSLPEALATGADQPRDHPSAAPSALSIACTQSTYQAVHAVRATNGAALLVDDARALAARRELGRAEGAFLELSSAVAWAALQDARRDGVIAAHESVVMVGTSPGLKDQQLPGDEAALEPVAPELDEVLAWLRLEPLASASRS